MSAEPSDDWPKDWLSREATATARMVMIGTQQYHQITVAADDDTSISLVAAQGYRLCLIQSDPQDPTKHRHAVYRKRAPYHEAEHE